MEVSLYLDLYNMLDERRRGKLLSAVQLHWGKISHQIPYPHTARNGRTNSYGTLWSSQGDYLNLSSRLTLGLWSMYGKWGLANGLLLLNTFIYNDEARWVLHQSNINRKPYRLYFAENTIWILSELQTNEFLQVRTLAIITSISENDRLRLRDGPAQI